MGFSGKACSCFYATLKSMFIKYKHFVKLIATF
jgi:hypothetical protein